MNNTLYGSALTATLVHVSKYAVMAHVKYAVYLCGGSIRSALRLLFVLQRKRICSVWCLLLSADGRRKFLLEVQSLFLRGKEILLVLRKERATFLTPSLLWFSKLWHSQLSISPLLSTLKPCLIFSYCWSTLVPPPSHIQILVTHLFGRYLRFPYTQ